MGSVGISNVRWNRPQIGMCIHSTTAGLKQIAPTYKPCKTMSESSTAAELRKIPFVSSSTCCLRDKNTQQNGACSVQLMALKEPTATASG